jgi:hypothetical protein
LQLLSVLAAIITAIINYQLEPKNTVETDNSLTFNKVVSTTWQGSYVSNGSRFVAESGRPINATLQNGLQRLHGTNPQTPDPPPGSRTYFSRFAEGGEYQPDKQEKHPGDAEWKHTHDGSLRAL